MSSLKLLVVAPLIAILPIFTGCHNAVIRSPATCHDLEQQINLRDPILTLNLLADAYEQECYQTVLRYGAIVRPLFRHKTFSVVAETVSLFVPDGTATEYVLESYERGFLSILLAASYIRVERLDDAKVELRLLDHELFTPLYNYGEDPVNIVLSAVMWERLGAPEEARVDWLRLRDLGGLVKQEDPVLRDFASQQIRRIDDGETSSPWQVYGIGRFPRLDWNIEFLGSQNGYFSVKTKEMFSSSCVSDTGLLLSTASWFQKIATRHSHAYHPLLNMQSWIRLPIGMVYTLVPITAGAGIAVGGCMADAALAGKHGGALCELSIVGGVALMSTAPRVWSAILKPDLRHWEHVPAAFLFTATGDVAAETCATYSPMYRFIGPRRITNDAEDSVGDQTKDDAIN